MSNEYQEYKDLYVTNNGQKTHFDAKVSFTDGKPCAAVLSESPNNQGTKFSEVSDRAMIQTANGLVDRSPTEMKGGDKIYMFAENDNGSFKQQPFEVKISGSMHDQSAQEKTLSAFSANNSTEHQPLESISKEKMEMTVSQLQGKNPLAENSMPQIDSEAEQRANKH